MRFDICGRTTNKSFQILKKMKKNQLTLIIALLAIFVGYSQSSLKGKVLDESNVPLGGASVIVKGTKTGVATDFDGNFEISSLQENTTLLVSYIGYVTKEVAITNEAFVTIQLLPDSEKLNEIVVTALGITKSEKKIGYATQKIDTEIIDEINTPNVGNLFTGQVAGLSVSNPTGLLQSPSFSLRGKTPLIVIDGIAVETDFFDVSGNNIADINVLKGTTASALYGSRGRNGAILITTKKC